MDRRNAVRCLFAGPIVGFTAFKVLDEDSDHIDLEEETAIAAVRHNGKTFALGFKLMPGDPRTNATQAKWLGSALSHTIAGL